MAIEICGDFKLNKCTRGRYCKFYHPKLLVCKDFQNIGCRRDKCRFLHVTKEEEETYKKGGGLPQHISQDEARRKTLKTPPNWRNETSDANVDRKRKWDEATMGDNSDTHMHENLNLKRRVKELQQQINELKSLNRMLISENETLRSKYNLSVENNPIFVT